jgi:catechol 2,3-dioxygenase-like lactoylglutathione lyase family enzyme
MRLGQINLYVRDLDASARFYAHTLGFAVTDRGDDHCTIGSDDVEITLFPTTGDPDRAPDRGTNPGMTADLIVDDLDGVIELIEANGGEADVPREWSGGRYALFTDPDGIGWELIEERPVAG